MRIKSFALIASLLIVFIGNSQQQFSKGQSDYTYPINWNDLGYNSFGTTAIIQEMMNIGTSGSSNFPTMPLYPYGVLMNFNTQINSARAQMYISHSGNDLIFRGGWGTDWQSWNKVLTNINFSNYAFPSQGGVLNGYLRTGQYIKITGGYGDDNDGKICNSQFAQGLNVVGINNDQTHRKIALWGEISQQENGGVNSWAGNNNFGGNIQVNGKIAIGTNNPGNYQLAVEGIVGARKIKVTQGSWADYVFKPNYKLRPLSELEAYIKKYKHLPDVPSEQEVLGKDIDISETQVLLLKKIEELTLYVIELKKENEKQQTEINILKRKK